MADTVLVTGASGFIATHCILALLEKGYSVRGTVRDSARAPALNALLAKHDARAAGISLLRADLTSDDGWAKALEGCRYVLHVASPNPLLEPKDRDALVAPAREGALRVLRAAKAAGVQRVVLTSSIVAITGIRHAGEHTYTEADWTNADAPEATAYTRSKTLAERAAWDYANSEGRGLELATVNPVLVLGPVLEKDFGTSAELIHQILGRKVPGFPRLGFSIVDVRDVAALHLLAMTSPAAKGERFIATESFLWMEEVGAILRAAFPDRRIPKANVPDFAVRLMSMVNPPVKRVLPELGRRRDLSWEKAKSLLGWKPRSAKDAILATAKSMIELGIV